MKLKLLPLILFGIAVTSLSFVQPAQAYTVTLQQMGANVVATGSGPINLTGLTFQLSEMLNLAAGVNPSGGIISTGPTGIVNLDLYTGFTGPTSFGIGPLTAPNTGSGDFVSIQGAFGFLFLPHGYVSGAALSDSMTFNNATFASLGATPGTYEWTWGTGLANQNFTLVIGAAGVPDGGSTVSLLGCALLGLAALRRKLGC
jgi:VPDSG-CTERM motif